MAPDPTEPGMMHQAVAIAELADELGCYKSALFKIAKRLDIQPLKQRDAARGNQLISVVTQVEAERIRTEYSASRRASAQVPEDAAPVGADEGTFYLIQLEPEHDPGRFKVGFTTDLEGRLRRHRCSAPFAQCTKSWPCRRTWERAAIDCITTGLEQLHTEVFRTESLDEVGNRGDQFFRLMPPVRVVTKADDEEPSTK